MQEDRQYRLPLPMPSRGIDQESLMAAQTEFEETKIRILGDIRTSMTDVLSNVKSITQFMKESLALTQRKVDAEKLSSTRELEERREGELKTDSSEKTLRETMQEGKGFFTILTAFLIPAIIGFVDTLFDLTEPLGLLKGAITGLAIWFGSRALLMLLAGGIKMMVAKLGAAIISAIATANIGGRIAGLFTRGPGAAAPVMTGPPAPVLTGPPRPTPAAGAPRTAGVGAGAGRAGGAVRGVMGSGLLRGAGAMLGAAAALFVLSKALENFSEINWEDLGKAGVAAIGLGAALGVLTVASAPLAAAAPKIALFGASLIPLSAALALASPFVRAFGEALGKASPFIQAFGEVFEGFASVIDSVSGVISSAFEGVASVIDSLSGGLVSTLQTISELNPAQLFEAALGITALSGALLALGAGTLVNGLIRLFTGSRNPIDSLTALGEVAPNIVQLASVLENFGNIVYWFTEALNNLDASKAMGQFAILRDGILMVGEAINQLNTANLVAFTSLTGTGRQPVISQNLQSVSRAVQESAELTQSPVARPRYSQTPEDFEAKKATGRLTARDVTRFYSENPQKLAVAAENAWTGGQAPISMKVDAYLRSEYSDQINQLQGSQRNRFISELQTRQRGFAAQSTAVVPTASVRTEAMNELGSEMRAVNLSSAASAQPAIVSVNNVNSVNKNETNFRSTSLGSALQGDALRHVY